MSGKLTVGEITRRDWDAMCGWGAVISYKEHTPILMSLPRDKEFRLCAYCNTNAKGVDRCPNCGGPR